LTELPDISKWRTNNVRNMNHLFSNCLSLKLLPDISNWNLENVKDISYMFYSCSSLISLPDISKWNTKNINYLNSIFENCSTLNFIPISKWKFKNKIKINNIFKGCKSLLIVPNISKWNTNISEINISSSLNSSSLSIKLIKSDSLISGEIENLNSPKDSSSSENNKDKNPIENINNISTNEELDDYYENFYQ